MRPDERELDDEIRGHIALAIKARVDRGEDPEAARRAAYAEFGYIPAAREAMRQVWYSRWYDAAMDLGRDIRVGMRSLSRARGLSAAVIATLALGIGANTAIFTVVRAVLLTPLVNRDEDRLIYVRQSAPDAGSDNLTFSVPEIDDLKSRVTSVSAFGDFSTIDFTMTGLGDPRVVKAGVVSGTFFDVMGLRPALGRLVAPGDDGPKADGVAVLTYRFWQALGADPNVLGKTVRLDMRAATVIGVLEPSVPYPTDTEIIANIVTSPHHLDATMVTGRTHRMTELFGRLAPGTTLEAARAEIEATHAALKQAHPDAYAGRGDVRVRVRQLRDQIATPARSVLLVLLAASAVVFLIACSNVASLILARSVRRDGELAVRAALGAGRFALRRTLLAESLVLCGAGAALGLLMAPPLVAVVARFASRFSVRALDVTFDAGLTWLGVALALIAAVVLAFVPRLPTVPATASQLTGSGLRVTPGVRRRLSLFATAQIACSFVLLAAAGALVAALLALQQRQARPDFDRVLALDVPLPIGYFGPKTVAFVDDAVRRLSALPGVERVAVSNVVPWRDAGKFGPFPFTAEGYTPINGEEAPRAWLRNVSPGYFAAMGLPLVAGRAFTDDDRGGAGVEPVAIISQSMAERLFPEGGAVNRTVRWNDDMLRGRPSRVVGVVADFNDEHAQPVPVAQIYHPIRQVPFGGRLFLRAASGIDPYSLVAPATRAIREMAPEQPVERAATLADIRSELLAPDRVSALVVTGFATVALLVTVVGMAGVLAFTVSARTREFGVRLAVGSRPRELLLGVLKEGAVIVAVGVAFGAAGGYVVTRLAARVLDDLPQPGLVPVVSAMLVLAVSALAAALLPAARAARVDVLQALRTE